jgi:glycosyltransferase involved in cell wall biosynthesis
MELSTGFANLCDAIIAPSESVEAELRTRGVTVPIEVIPTGVGVDRFAFGDGAGFRTASGIPPGAFVVGHVGRLAPEKNLDFLAHAVAGFLQKNNEAHFIIAGIGPSRRDVENIFEEAGLSGRLHFTGIMTVDQIPHFYHAMDVFAFASKTETQGMVLTEAMAAGVPVVALDAPGAREIVKNGRNGRLLDTRDPAEFCSALAWIAGLPGPQRTSLSAAARKTGARFSLERTATKSLNLYRSVWRRGRFARPTEGSAWSTALQMIAAEWDIWVNRTRAAKVALTETPAAEEGP